MLRVHKIQHYSPFDACLEEGEWGEEERRGDGLRSKGRRHLPKIRTLNLLMREVKVLT